LFRASIASSAASFNTLSSRAFFPAEIVLATSLLCSFKAFWCNLNDRPEAFARLWDTPVLCRPSCVKDEFYTRFKQGLAMPSYRIYELKGDGQFTGPPCDVVCSDDMTAAKIAQGMMPDAGP
jgi:hypothetical protein